jgi:hypothetical protein
LRFAIIAVAVCAAFILLFCFPELGRGLALENPNLAYCFWPCLLYVWLCALPCVVVLVLGWLVAGAIGMVEAFTLKCARWLKWAAACVFAAAVILFCGNVVIFVMGMLHPGMALASMLVGIFGIAFGIVLAVLSRYIAKAAELREQTEGLL